MRFAFDRTILLRHPRDKLTPVRFKRLVPFVLPAKAGIQRRQGMNF